MLPELSPSPTFATEPYRPAARSSYRFGRSRQETSAPPEAESPLSPSQPTLQPHRVERVEQHGHRPLRRAGWVVSERAGLPTRRYVSRAPVVSVCSHMFPVARIQYRAKIEAASRASAPVEAASPALPAILEDIRASMDSSSAPPSGQPGRGSTPYSPGGRGGHAPSQPISGHDMPYLRLLPELQAALEGRTLHAPGGPYGGYEPYDPYAFGSHETSRLSMTGPLPWDVPCVVVAIPVSPAAVMSRIAIHGARASRHDLPAPPTIIDANRE